MKHAGFTVHRIYYIDWLNKFNTMIGISILCLLHTYIQAYLLTVPGRFLTTLPDRIL